MTRNLRVAAPDEKPPTPAAPMTVTQAADGGDRLELLVAMRTRLAITVESEGTPPRDLAALSRRLMDVAKEIESLTPAEPVGEKGGTGDGSFDAAAI